MTNPTTPFSWQMPTSSDLVTDLPADFETFGQAVATSMADLLGGTSGQVLSKASNTDMDFTWVTTDDTNAIQNAIVDAKGDLIGATAADTPARLAVGSDGQLLTADSTAATGLSYQNNFAAGKNKLINADCRFNQRSFTSTTTTGTFGFDRFKLEYTGGTATYSAQTFTAGTAPVSGYEAANFMRIVTVSQSAVGDFAGISQPIEDVRTFAGQTVAFSVWAKASTGTPKIGFNVEQAFGTGGSATVPTSAATQTITTSWARYTFTINVPSIAGKTIGTGSPQLNTRIFTSAGTSISGAGYPAVGIQNVTIDLWGWQLEAGSVATAFQTATGNISGELAACQRYYYASDQTVIWSGNVTTANNYYLTVYYPVPMRVSPTTVTTTNTGGANFAAGNPSTTVVGKFSFWAFLASNGTGVGNYQFSYTATAEL